MVAAFPFGLVYGVAVTQSPIDPWLGFAASFVILAGAAQLSLLDLMFEASWAVAVGTALVINLRFVLYSAALSPDFAEFPARWRLPLPYLMTDQAATISVLEFDRVADPRWRRWFYFWGGLSFASAWWVGSAVGITFGGTIPDSWQIAFAFPLMFIALLVPTLRSRPALVAALVGAAVTVAAADLPNGLNICLGALAGVVAGSLIPSGERSA
jgi:predicted branched-subunit amino acid permease